jgi:FlaA1/EpsC-like NDP-sugar epimerase
MGASKRLMEHVALSEDRVAPGLERVASARFANVAFSDGSLLHSFLRRLERRQPLAAPRDARRYFISLSEAGQICLLAALCAPSRHLLVPRLDPGKDLHTLESIAANVLRSQGLEPRIFTDEAEAREAADRQPRDGTYPLLLTPLDTAGEKPYEEFVGAGESTVEIGLSQLLAVPYLPAPPGSVRAFLERVQELVDQPEKPARKEDIVRALSVVVAELRHADHGRCLDERM